MINTRLNCQFELFLVSFGARLNEVHNSIQNLKISQKYLLFINLQKEIKKNEFDLLKFSKNANNPEYLKGLLNVKKDVAIEEILKILPFLKSGNTDAIILFLNILPVMFSYVSLFDTRVKEAFQITDILRVHPAFLIYQHIFHQWFVLFDRRRNSKKPFAYKDESYVRSLPDVDTNCSTDHHFVNNVGYSNIGLLRAFHRWLRLHRLHKYLYFFANLSYNEILQINESNFSFYEKKVNVQDVTIGAKNKIVRELEYLRNRPSRLNEIIQSNFSNLEETETGIREIKKIIRTPIALSINPHQNIPSLLMEALSKVFNVMQKQIVISESIIPVYGLLISLLKEAWNYSIFQRNEKECFNEWRQRISEKINNNTKLEIFPGKRNKFMNGQINNLFSVSTPQESSASILFDRCLEDIATCCGNYVLQ